jgi:hypothetical protein
MKRRVLKGAVSASRRQRGAGQVSEGGESTPVGASTAHAHAQMRECGKQLNLFRPERLDCAPCALPTALLDLKG